MDSFGITRYTGGGSISVVTNPSSLIQSLAILFHGGQIAEAEKELRIAMLRAQTEDRKLIIDSLTKIATETEDLCLKQQMFFSIMSLSASWH